MKSPGITFEILKKQIMNYQETLNWLFAQLPMYQREGQAAYKANLDNTLQLDEYFRHPHKNFKTIHVAGTNGKGSVSHMLASILQQAGYKTGLYTSPHLKDFRERIKINGEMISEQYVIDFVRHHADLFSRVKPSFFEMTVAMAFKYFADSQVDIAVIEVGLGGRLDSTNIITPLASVITNISFDHMALLGNTLEKIASEKAGIIKPGIPVVIGTRDKTYDFVFEQKAQTCETPIEFASDNWTTTINIDGSFQLTRKNGWHFDHLTSELKGLYGTGDYTRFTTSRLKDQRPASPARYRTGSDEYRFIRTLANPFQPAIDHLRHGSQYRWPDRDHPTIKTVPVSKASFCHRYG